MSLERCHPGLDPGSSLKPAQQQNYLEFAVITECCTGSRIKSGMTGFIDRSASYFNSMSVQDDVEGQPALDSWWIYSSRIKEIARKMTVEPRSVPLVSEKPRFRKFDNARTLFLMSTK